MIGGKNNAVNRMYLAGLQAQSSVYGTTIPSIYGCPRSSLLMTWQHDFRQGASSKKGKKKGVTTYIERATFMIGHNPIAGVLQVWQSQTKNALNRVKYTTTVTLPGSGGNAFNVTIPDAKFYFVIGVTANVDYSVVFNDYGGNGSRSLSGTYEMPLWNLNYAGPDPTNQSGYKYFPAVYQWIPYSGNVVHFPAGAVSFLPHAFGTVTVNIYYAQLISTDTLTPLQKANLHFEAILGNGDEYPSSSNPEQQILYPAYAGVGGSAIDCGVTGMAPVLLTETVGSFPINPSGDADHADIIEDIFKSGPAQAGTGAALAYGDIHHGLGCLDFPGPIQKKFVFGNAFGAGGSITFDLPNTAGNILFCISTQVGTGLTITGDTAGNTWIPLVGGSTAEQAWYCVANASPSNTVHFTGTNGDEQVVLLEVAGLDTVDGTPGVSTGSAGTYSTSITTTNKPGEYALMFSFLMFFPGSAPNPPVPPHWKRVIKPFPDPNQGLIIDSRLVKQPGTYPLSYSSIPGWTAVTFALKNSQPNTFVSPLGNILDDDSMDLCRAAARAYGISGSLVMDSQKKAADWLKELYEVLNAAPVWSGDKLKSIPYAEASAVGNGAIYTSPTAAGPIANLTEADFFTANDTDVPVIIARSAQVDAPNLQQIQNPNRENDYNVTVTAQPDNASMSLYGTRKASPQVFASITTSLVARMILGIKVRVANILRNTYTFKLQAKWSLLEAMDLITIPIQSAMPALSPAQPASGTIALRLTKVTVDDKFGVDCEAEPFIYGLRTPIPVDQANTTTGQQIGGAVVTTKPNPQPPSFNASPGSVNAPVFIEAVPALPGTPSAGELVVAASGPSANYGGCIAYMSTDGGSSYKVVGPNNGVLQGSATTGVTVGDWPPAADPDTTNDLAVDLTESLGSLASYQVADEDNFLYPCYVAGGGTSPVPYELMCYAVANLTAAHKYTLKATGGGTNHLRRAVFNAPTASLAVDHGSGSRFAFVDPNNPRPSGILRVPLVPAMTGTTLYFKFTAFNTVGGGTESLASVTAYPYTVLGLANLPSGGGSGGGLSAFSGVITLSLTPGAPGNFTVPHGQSSAPSLVLIQMNSGGSIWLQRPVSFDGTNVYLAASDAGVTGTAICVFAAPSATLSLSPGAPGNFTIAHGQSVAPALVLIQMNSGGAIWLQSPISWDALNLYLTASDAGITGKAYLWAAIPQLNPLGFTRVALAPGSPGNFTVPHLMGQAPTLVIVRMKSGGAIWLQSPTAHDGTNLYLVASDGGIAGEADCWAT